MSQIQAGEVVLKKIGGSYYANIPMSVLKWYGIDPEKPVKLSVSQDGGQNGPGGICRKSGFLPDFRKISDAPVIPLVMSA